MKYDYDDVYHLAAQLYKERDHASSGQYLSDMQDAETILYQAEEGTPIRLLIENPELRVTNNKPMSLREGYLRYMEG